MTHEAPDLATNDAAQTSARMEALEVKVAFQEHLLGELDDVIRSLRDEIDGLRLDLKTVREEVQQLAPAPENTKPPHY